MATPAGTHGVNWGAKLGGGYYAYGTNQHANVLTIIDPDPNGDGDGADGAVVGTILLDNESTGAGATDGTGGQGIKPLLKSVNAAHAAAFAKLSTPKLTRELQAAVEQQPPPRKGIFRPKMRYAHQGGQNPPLVVIHGNALDAVPDSYRRYLETRFRNAFDLAGTPLRIEFKSSHNPYAQES